jgi:hypothetical protein
VWDNGRACEIDMTVLNGYCDDSFNVYVRDDGKWELIYTYKATPANPTPYPTGTGPQEVWNTHTIKLEREFSKSSLDIMIVPTSVQQCYFDEAEFQQQFPLTYTFGHLAVDVINVFGSAYTDD